MRTLLLTTIIASALATPLVMAQPADPAVSEGSMMAPEINVPEGFAMQEIALTAEDLLGATVYDADGDSIGDVHDLVLNVGASGDSTPAMGGANDGRTDSDTMTGTGMSPENSGGMIGAMPDGGTTTGSGAASEGSTNTKATTRVDGAGAGGTATGSGPADSVTDSAMPDAGSDAATPTMDGNLTSPEGAVTHAVLDIGGFLGMGKHSVAVPIADLAIYRRENETRIYLPWMRQKLEALPAYNEDDPGTLSQPAIPTKLEM